MKFCLFMIICFASSLCFAQQGPTDLGALIKNISKDYSSIKETFDPEINQNIQVVGIGDVGFQLAMQPNQLKFNLIKYLIENKDFRKILLDIPDYQLSEINRYLDESSLPQNEELLDSIINRQTVYDLGVVLATPEFRQLIDYLKERNSRGLPKIALGGFGIGIPPPRYFIANYTLKTDSAFTVEINKKIVNQLNGKEDVLAFQDVADWYNEKKAFLKAKLTPDDFRKLTRDIDNINAFTHLNTLGDLNEFSAFRDSCAVNNIIGELTEKSIVLSRNFQIAKDVTDQASGVKIKTLGSYLDKILQSGYYSILTDFSNKMTFISGDRSKQQAINAQKTSTAYILKKNLNLSEGLFLSKDFQQLTIPVFLNNVIANAPLTEEALSLLVGSNKSFDAFFILKDISFSTGK